MKTFVAAVLSVFCALTVLADSPDEAVRGYLLDTYDGRFADPRPGTAQFERKVRYAQRVRCIRVDRIDLQELTVAGDTAVARLEVTVSKRDRQAPREWMDAETTPLRVKVVREQDRWRVSAVESLDVEFAAQIAAASEDEARRLLREHPTRITRGLGRALYERALALLNGAKFDDGARTAVLAREVASSAGDQAGEALAIGVMMFVKAETDAVTGLKLSNEAVRLTESVTDPDVLARVWYNHGRAYSSMLGRMDNALREAERANCYRKALAFAERAEDPSLQTRVLYSLANIAAARADSLTARRYIDRMLPIARELGDTHGEASAESVLATIYFEQDDRERAMLHHNRAMALSEKTKSYAYWSLLIRSGTELAADGRYEEARAFLDRVLVRDERGVVSTRGPVPGGHIRDGLVALGAIAASQGRHDEAECLTREAGGDRDLHKLATYPLANGDGAYALRLSLASLSDTGLVGSERAAALKAAAHAYRALGQPARALVNLLEAIEIRESLDANLAGGVQQRARVSDRIAEYYKLAAELSIDQGDAIGALTFLERGRARALTATIEDGRPGATEDADAAARQERERREAELARLSRELDRARASGSDKASLSDELRQARGAYASFLDGLAARSQRRAVAKRGAETTNVGDALQRLPAGMVAVAYLVTDERIHAFVARRDTTGTVRVSLRTKDVPRKVVEQRVDEFLESVSNRDLHVDVAARKVYDLVVAPIEGAIARADALLIVPDDVLWRVPFAALADARKRFFVERAPIVYAPSITACAVVAAAGREKISRPVTLFAVGNPTLDVTSKNAFVSLYRDATLGPLPEAEREVDTVRALYGPRAVVLKGLHATEDRTKAAIGGAEVVHFATHALFDDTHPMYSRLALAQGESASDDGWLESWEIARLSLAADIVVLSACETARGRIGGGEGVVGMAWSFFVAGARSTVATQWKVGSNSTAELMIAFHRALRAGRDPSMLKAHALRSAQLEMLRDERYRHPFYWGAFVLLGDPSAHPEK